ncbi:hypothetical protein M0804_012511 [Polistes exclamans]|nr:hypothetical protein M0804_012511 [Polistes exclamans]
MEVLIHEATNKREIIDGTSSVNHHNDTNLNGNKITTLDRKEKDENDLNVSYGKKINEINTVDIIFENITYNVPLGFRKGRKEILHGINGRLNAKQLIALMGPSGAGKSSLLDVLSGFRETGVDGVIYVNGRIRELRSFSRYSAYITQNDCLEPLLTVLENMRVAADLKLPINTPKYQKETVIEEILTTLGLYEHINTRTGQLSGGQKKRLSVALELVNNPTVMFLDEPTTGLDSSSCMQVIKLLKLLAKQGRTIICTIHQPSASIFKIFDHTLIYLRIVVNVMIGLLLGMVFTSSGNDGDRVLDNYNLLFSILIHHMMTTMMLTIVTFPMQLDKLIKEHFNRWYSLKAFYITITLLDIPVSTICCFLFSVIIYPISSQPLEIERFIMFFTISLLVSFIAQGTGLMIGAVLNVVNGTFVGPTLSVPLMMFAGFGVSLKDLPNYLKWGSYVSFLRYGLEGFVGAIYGMDRPVLPCMKNEEPLYCHYKYPNKFLTDISMKGDQFWNDVIALLIILLITRVCAYFLLKWKIFSLR